MIIAKSEFLLIEFYNKNPVRAIECSNTLDGGATLIRDFFFPPIAEPPTGEDYDFGILSALDFHLAESHAQLHFVDGSCYLGSGATSHVFRVNIDGEVFAMKILISEDTACMFTEYRTLQSMAAAGAPVVSVHPDSFREQVIDGATVSASYLMAIGDSVCPSGKIAEAVKALQDLHPQHRFYPRRCPKGQPHRCKSTCIYHRVCCATRCCEKNSPKTCLDRCDILSRYAI